ncbi:hypothetical protein FJZ17_03725 [Candidatus Pacearchaeota archaeon]|nr:hypothetical protein [Candidatus Pacearchaeota archaeon]
MIRRITSREEIEKKRERNNKIIVIVLGLIMLLSSAGYFASDYASNKANSIDYNNVNFKQNDYGYWDFELNSQKYTTLYNPLDVANVSIEAEKALGEYAGKTLYFASPGSEDYSEGARAEILTNLGYFISKTNFACLNSDCIEDYPIKNCSSDSLVLFELSNKSSVKSKEKCIIIQYKEGEAELVADAFLYRILGLK